MDGLGFPLEGNLFPTKLQLEMDCCASTSVERIVVTIVTTTTTTTTILGKSSSTIETLIVFYFLKKNQDFGNLKATTPLVGHSSNQFLHLQP
jgi:hypothetical protein